MPIELTAMNYTRFDTRQFSYLYSNLSLLSGGALSGGQNQSVIRLRSRIRKETRLPLLYERLMRGKHERGRQIGQRT